MKHDTHWEYALTAVLPSPRFINKGLFQWFSQVYPSRNRHDDSESNLLARLFGVSRLLNTSADPSSRLFQNGNVVAWSLAIPQYDSSRPHHFRLSVT